MITQNDWRGGFGLDKEENIRCPTCMDEQMLSQVTVYWVSHVEGGKVLHAACDRGHEFEHGVVDDE